MNKENIILFNPSGLNMDQILYICIYKNCVHTS